MTESFAIVYTTCVNCHVPLAINPTYCPSLRINGERQPLCPSCFAKWNEIHRTSKGLEPLPLHPQAYEACSEYELRY